MQTRINKYLAERGVCSRRKADVLIDNKQVTVDGRIAIKGLLVSGNEDIRVNGKTIMALRPQVKYFAFHKPVGILTSVDPHGRDTIATYLNLKERLFPVGRLDVASSGLLILTNDGNLSEAVTHPRGNHEKEYVVTLKRAISNDDLKKMERGMIILGTKTKKTKIVRESPTRFRIILTEGRHRQIRRMCEQLHYDVMALKRIRVMNIQLGNLAPGALRPLAKQEISELLKGVRSC